MLETAVVLLATTHAFLYLLKSAKKPTIKPAPLFCIAEMTNVGDQV